MAKGATDAEAPDPEPTTNTKKVFLPSSLSPFLILLCADAVWATTCFFPHTRPTSLSLMRLSYESKAIVLWVVLKGTAAPPVPPPPHPWSNRHFVKWNKICSLEC